jgi:hypothetical protein
MQQKIVAPNYNGVATMKVKGIKARLDLYAGQPQAISTITDLNTGDVIVLLHHRKMFSKTPGAPMKQTRPASSGTAAKVAPPRSRATGKIEKVGSHDTEIYTWSNPRGVTGRLWVAKNFPNYAKIRSELAKVDKSTISMNNNLDPELSALPGMTVKTQITGGGQTITVTLLSAREEPVAASLFGVPGDYREMPKPKPLKPINPPPKTLNQLPPQKASSTK